MRISIRVCDAQLALSSIEMATCDLNSIDLIIEVNVTIIVPLKKLYTGRHCHTLLWPRISFAGSTSLRASAQIAPQRLSKRLMA